MENKRIYYFSSNFEFCLKDKYAFHFKIKDVTDYRLFHFHEIFFLHSERQTAFYVPFKNDLSCIIFNNLCFRIVNRDKQLELLYVEPMFTQNKTKYIVYRDIDIDSDIISNGVFKYVFLIRVSKINQYK